MSETLKDTFSKLRKESFDQLHWREVIAASNIKQCRAYEVAFRDKAKEFEQNGQTESASACRALQVVSMLNIRLDNPRQPFRESRMTPGVQFPDSGDLGEPLLAILSVLVHEATDPEFKARLADVCWTTQKKRDFQLVAIAIESCIASA